MSGGEVYEFEWLFYRRLKNLCHRSKRTLKRTWCIIDKPILPLLTGWRQIRSSKTLKFLSRRWVISELMETERNLIPFFHRYVVNYRRCMIRKGFLQKIMLVSCVVFVSRFFHLFNSAWYRGEGKLTMNQIMNWLVVWLKCAFLLILIDN